MNERIARRALLAAVVILVSGWTAAARAAPHPAAGDVDRAAQCLRRGDPGCAIVAAERAITALDHAPSASLTREIQVVYAQALALGDRASDAAVAFERVLSLWPGWRPPPDADPRVTQAIDVAATKRIIARLPAALPLPATPALPTPDTASLTPPPQRYAPDHLRAVVDDAPDRFSLGLGGGVAILLGEASDRFDPGVHVALDFAYVLGDRLELWFETLLALAPITDGVAAEPGYGRGISVWSLAVGVRYALPLVGDLHAVGAVAVGAGLFGVRSVSEVAGLSVHGALGLRYDVDTNLSFHLEAAPLLIVSPDEAVRPAGHLTFLLRGETHF